jgi:hypothetical protein
MLSGISITCFASSYAVTLVLEASRLFLRLPIRWIVMILFAAAGLFAHTVYLATLTRQELQTANVTPLATWYDWCLMAAWVLAASYLVLAVRRPATTVGIFLLPLVLALIGTGHAVRQLPPFDRVQAASYWAVLHGIMLLLGTVVAALGFAAGVMYLLQSYRLKRKLPPRPGFRLPTLEWLQRVNRRALWLSTFLLGLGLVAGLALNLIRQSDRDGTVSWTDPVVISSGVLFLWLAMALICESLYKPARAGSKVAYVTMSSFVFLVLVLCLVLLGQHGITRTPGARSRMPGVSRQALFHTPSQQVRR